MYYHSRAPKSRIETQIFNKVLNWTKNYTWWMSQIRQSHFWPNQPIMRLCISNTYSCALHDTVPCKKGTACSPPPTRRTLSFKSIEHCIQPHVVHIGTDEKLNNASPIPIWQPYQHYSTMRSVETSTTQKLVKVTNLMLTKHIETKNKFQIWLVKHREGTWIKILPYLYPTNDIT